MRLTGNMRRRRKKELKKYSKDHKIKNFETGYNLGWTKGFEACKDYFGIKGIMRKDFHNTTIPKDKVKVNKKGVVA